jgi:hypothetical protein
VSPPLTADDLRGLSDLVRTVALRSLPRDYENTKEWGSTKEVWAGVKVSQDGLRLSTHSRTKTVNHGSWKRYRAWLVDPDKDLGIQLENVRSIPGKGTAFDLIIDLHLGATGRWSEWRQGVQLYSLSADAMARVRMRMACELGMSLAFSGAAPELILAPTVSAANLELTDFRLHRVSKLDGPVIHKLGLAIRDVLQTEIDEREVELAAKINRQIDKQRDALRIAPRELLNKGLDKLLAGAVGGLK